MTDTTNDGRTSAAAAQAAAEAATRAAEVARTDAERKRDAAKAAAEAEVAGNRALNDRLHAAHLARLEAARVAKRAEGEAREAARIKADLRDAFLAVPGASEQHFEQAYPDLLKRWQIDAALHGPDGEKAAQLAKFGVEYRM